MFKKIFEHIFDRDITLSAASLSFYTIFSIIPMLIIFMIILTSLESFDAMYQQVQNMIFSNFLPMNHELILSYINSFLQHSVNISLVSGFSLFISSLLFFQNYEYVANNVFKTTPRTFIKSLGVYVLLIFITPISLGTVFYISIYFAGIKDFVPYIILWVLMFILFKVSANTKISTKSSLISSMLTALFFTIAKELFIYYVVLNKLYMTIYGSFSIVLFLFLWIYFSWIIFLNGLKLCHGINEYYQAKDT